MSPDSDEILELRKRIEKLEGRMGFLFRSLGINEDDAQDWKPSTRILELLSRGKRNEAIKAFREESGASLKDAKLFMEGIDKNQYGK